MSARKFDLYKAKKYDNVRVEHENGLRHTDGDKIRVILHQTRVVSWNRRHGAVTLDSGGWRTRTTQTAIRTALKQIPGFMNVGVASHKGQWYVYVQGHQFAPFQDGMCITSDEVRAFEQQQNVG
jgi:hypothetical protein